MKRPQKLAVMLVPTPPYEICGLTDAQVALVPNVSNGSLVAPAGTLSWSGSGTESVVVTSMSIGSADDTVSAFNSNPTGVHLDTVITVGITVVPESSAGLLALLGASLLVLRRRR